MVSLTVAAGIWRVPACLDRNLIKKYLLIFVRIFIHIDYIARLSNKTNFLDKFQSLVFHVSDLRLGQQDFTVQCEGRDVGGDFPAILFGLQCQD